MEHRNTKTLHTRNPVQPGGNIEIVDQKLSLWEFLDVEARYSQMAALWFAVNPLTEAPGQRLKIVVDVEFCLKEKWASLDR